VLRQKYTHLRCKGVAIGVAQNYVATSTPRLFADAKNF